MCPGAMPGGVCCARWTQIDGIARADVPCRPLERRLPCQIICGKAWNRALTAVRGRLGFFLQVIARADMPWSAVWRGSRRSMDTNRRHRASEDALEAPRMAIAVPGELQERVGPGADGCAWQVGVLPAKHRASRCVLEARGMAIAVSDESQEIPRTGILDVTD